MKAGAADRAAAGPRFITVDAAAELLSMSPSGIRKLISRGVIPSVRLGRALRIDVKALEVQLEAQARKSAGKGRRR